MVPLKQILDRHSITQQQLSEISGVPRPTIHNIIYGKTEPKLGQILAIIAGLKSLGVEITLSDFIDE